VLKRIFSPKWEVFNSEYEVVVAHFFTYRGARNSANRRNWKLFTDGIYTEDYTIYRVRRRLGV
jgi:hypothetical protein